MKQYLILALILNFRSACYQFLSKRLLATRQNAIVPLFYSVQQYRLIGNASSCRTILFFMCIIMAHANVSFGDEVLYKNKKQIQDMTKAEREELLNKYHQFKKLSPDQKEQLRELYKATREDNQLNEAKTVYYQWLGTLDPWDRANLRNEKDPQERIKLVRKLLARQKNTQNYSRMDFIDLFDEGILEDDQLILTPEELQSLFDQLEKKLLIGRKENSRLKELKPLHKQLTIMRMLQDKRRKKLVDAVDKTLMKSIENQQIKEELAKIENSQSKIEKMNEFVINSLLYQIRKNINEQKPTEAEEKEFFNQLDSATQDRLLSAPEDIRKFHLRMEILKQKNPDLINEFWMVMSPRVKKYRGGSRGRRSRFKDRNNDGPRSKKRPQ